MLRARRTDDSYPRSLSAKYGLGPFPLHTDGAHLRTPPDIVLLAATGPVSGMTLLLPIGSGPLAPPHDDDLVRGVFRIGGRGSTFYASALDKDGAVRFDPVCMVPIDPVARTAASWLRSAIRWAEPYSWDDPTRTLVIDNRRCLHGRTSVDGNSQRLLRRLMLQWEDR